jgi:hypothetical protein
MDGCGLEAWEQDSQSNGGEDYAGEEGFAVAMVEVVAGFEGVLVEEAVGGVERPDGEEHGGYCSCGEVDVVGPSDEPGPESGYRGRVEREEVPEGEWVAMAEGLGWRGVW